MIQNMTKASITIPVGMLESTDNICFHRNHSKQQQYLFSIE